MPEIFLSYRRRDSAGHARALERELKRHYRSGRVFFDQSSIEAGDVFPDTLHTAIAGCKVVVVVIAPDWLDATDAQGNLRLWQEEDFVRRELAQALEALPAGKRIIPVLCDETPMPDAAKLPPTLKALASIDALSLRGKGHEYESDLRKLLELLARIVPFDQTPREWGESAVSLPYLCDRTEQEGQLRDLLRSVAVGRLRRPVLCVVHGEAHEGHRPFVERVEGFTLPRRWRGLLARPNSRFVFVPASFRAQSAAAFAREFRTRFCEQLGIELLDTDEGLARGLGSLGAGLVAPYLILRSEDSLVDSHAQLEFLRDFWRNFPDLPAGLVVVCFALVKFAPSDKASRGWLRNLRQLFLGAKPGGVDAILRQRISEFQSAAAADPEAHCHVLTELTSALRFHVEEWAALDEVRRRLPGLSDEQISSLFGDAPAVPMERMHDRLGKLLST